MKKGFFTLSILVSLVLFSCVDRPTATPMSRFTYKQADVEIEYRYPASVSCAQRVPVTIRYKSVDSAFVSVVSAQTMQLPLLETTVSPGKIVFLFDSALPGKYILRNLTLRWSHRDGTSFDITLNPIEINVFSVLEGEQKPQLKPEIAYTSRFLFLAWLIPIAVLVCGLFGLLGFWLRRKQVNKGVQRESAGAWIAQLAALSTGEGAQFKEKFLSFSQKSEELASAYFQLLDGDRKTDSLSQFNSIKRGLYNTLFSATEPVLDSLFFEQVKEYLDWLKKFERALSTGVIQ